METVEYLMVGKDAALQGMVDESFMQSTVYRLEGNLISPLLKYTCYPSRYITGILFAGNRSRYSIPNQNSYGR